MSIVCLSILWEHLEKIIYNKRYDSSGASEWYAAEPEVILSTLFYIVFGYLVAASGKPGDPGFKSPV